MPNGIVAYSDPIATTLTDPRGQIEEKWKSRLTLVKDNDGMWTQVENEEDYMSLGEAAFRKIGLGGPVRTISFFAPSKMEDYWEPDSEVPKPFPEERTKEKEGRLDWSEDDREEEEELEMQIDAKDIEKMVHQDQMRWSLMKWCTRTRCPSKSCRWLARSENSHTLAANDDCWIA